MEIFRKGWGLDAEAIVGCRKSELESTVWQVIPTKIVEGTKGKEIPE